MDVDISGNNPTHWHTYQQHSKAGQVIAATDGFVLGTAVLDIAAVGIPASWTS